MIGSDDYFDALANRQRRRLLVNLLYHDVQHVSTLSEASREVAEAHESLLREFLSDSRSIAGVDKELLRKRHVHLPLLAEYGFITWYRTADVVTKGPRFDEIRPLLEVVDEHRDEHREADSVAVRHR